MDKNIDMKNKKNKRKSTSSYEEAAWIYFKELQVFVYSSACVYSCFSAYNTDSNAVYPEAY